MHIIRVLETHKSLNVDKKCEETNLPTLPSLPVLPNLPALPISYLHYSVYLRYITHQAYLTGFCVTVHVSVSLEDTMLS